MRASWSDPYLWVHLAGLAVVPLLLELCLLGLAVGDPLLPAGLELLLVAAIGILPIAWMQWQRPFCIFSLTALALKPSQMSEQQRRMLRLFKSLENRALAIAIALLLFFVLLWIYRVAPLAQSVAPFADARWAGLLLAAIAFLGCNLFLQVPGAVARVMLASDEKLNSLEPYPVEWVKKDFTLLGFEVNQILPSLKFEPTKTEQKPLQPESVIREATAGKAVLTPDASEAIAKGSKQTSTPVESTTSDGSPWDEEDFEASFEAPPNGLAETVSSAQAATVDDEDIWEEASTEPSEDLPVTDLLVTSEASTFIETADLKETSQPEEAVLDDADSGSNQVLLDSVAEQEPSEVSTTVETQQQPALDEVPLEEFVESISPVEAEHSTHPHIEIPLEEISNQEETHSPS